MNSKEWEKTLHVNVVSHYYFAKQAIPLLKKNRGGSIINLSSGAGIMGFPLRSPYAASKWAIIGLTKTLAMELGKFRIRVNAICPGTIKGGRMKRVIRDKAKFLKTSQKIIEKESIPVFIVLKFLDCWSYHKVEIGKNYQKGKKPFAPNYRPGQYYKMRQIPVKLDVEKDLKILSINDYCVSNF